MNMSSLSRRINKALKENTDYLWSSVCTEAYNGEGFYINNKEKVKMPLNIWAWDKHWAYGGVLKNKVFPLSEKMTTDKPTELAIYCVKYTYKKPRYNCFYYTLYGVKSINDMYFMTHLDYEIFKDLYESDIRIIKKYYFKDVGYLSDSMKDLVDEMYIEKKKGIWDKAMFEAAFYGMFAKCLNPETIRKKGNTVHFNDLVLYETAYSYTANPNIRDSRVPIAMWQSAYLRYEEWLLFKKYKNHVVYMNTDSIFVDVDINIEDSDLIGHYHKEYDNLPVFFLRRNSYIVLNKDMKSIYKCKLGGATRESQDRLTIDDVNRILYHPEEVLELETNLIKYGKKIPIPYRVTRNFLIEE